MVLRLSRADSGMTAGLWKLSPASTIPAPDNWHCLLSHLHLISIHANQAGHLGFLLCACVDDGVSFLDAPLVHTHIGQLPEATCLQYRCDRWEDSGLCYSIQKRHMHCKVWTRSSWRWFTSWFRLWGIWLKVPLSSQVPLLLLVVLCFLEFFLPYWSSHLHFFQTPLQPVMWQETVIWQPVRWLNSDIPRNLIKTVTFTALEWEQWTKAK